MNSQMNQIDTVIVGGGQAGLAMSYLLNEQDREHVILEKRNEIGATWASRWDTFTLVTPNWSMQLPGFPYEGDDPDDFMTRDEVVEYLEAYAEQFDPPLRFGVEVTGVEKTDGEYQVHTSQGDYTCRNVVIAAGTYQFPKMPEFSSKVPEGILSIHSDEYENPEKLPEGAVMVVGGGQSGCQIAQEIHQSGHKVFLCVSKVGRLPRQYRGKDGMWWADKLGLFDQTPDDLDSLDERFDPNPRVSGKDGGQEINLHQFAQKGIVLLSRLEGLENQTALLGDDLYQNLKMADKFAKQVRAGADQMVEKMDLELPEESVEELDDGFRQPILRELDLKGNNVQTIIWATGYDWDFSWIDLPILDAHDYPVQVRGVTEYPGLYFVGLHWLHKRKSGLFYGLGEDVEYVAEQLAEREEMSSS